MSSQKLVPVSDLRRETMPIFFDMMNFDFTSSGQKSYSRFEDALVSGLDKYFGSGLGDLRGVSPVICSFF